MAELKDSGARREFDSGAVRDIAEGKGRCDLLPLEVVSSIFRPSLASDGNNILYVIGRYVRTGDSAYIRCAIRDFAEQRFGNLPTAMLEASHQYEDGARKYEDRNWEKGIPVHCFIDSGVRHYLKYLRGDDDEPHDRAFLWNMLGALWMAENHPELIDLPFATENRKGVA